MTLQLERVAQAARDEGASDLEVLDAVLSANQDSGGQLSAEECEAIALPSRPE